MSDVPPVPRLRALVFFGLLAFMNWGPFAEQVLGFESRYLRSWEMFNKVFDVCDVRYAQIQGGAEVPLDRYAYFGEIAKKSSNSSMRMAASLISSSAVCLGLASTAWMTRGPCSA